MRIIGRGRRNSGLASDMRRRGALRIIGAITAAALLVPGGAARAEYLLQPGDSLRLSAGGLPEGEALARIDMDGHVDFARIGRVPAAGRTLADVAEAIRSRAADRLITRFGSDGASHVIVLNADMIHVEIAEYRPVYVSGDVASPREIAYRPGLTARAAIAVAGGASRFPAVAAEGAPREITRLHAEFSTLALEHAAAVALRWRLDANLSGDPEPEDPDDAGIEVERDLFAQLVKAQRDRLAVDREDRAAQRAFLENTLARAREREAILRTQSEQEQAALVADEAEQQRVEQLLERGVTRMDSVLAIRRAVLLSSTRVLDTRNDLERVRQEIDATQRQVVALDAEHQRATMVERAAADQAIRVLATRLQGAREMLAAVGATPGSTGRETTAVLLHRSSGEGVGSRAAALDERLHPGDVVEVILTIDDILAP